MTTSIANDFIRLMDTIGATLDVPRIKSIHVASFEAIPQKNSKFGFLVLSDDTIGITYTGLGETLLDLQDRGRTSELVGMSPVQVAHMYGDDSDWQRSLGIAAINATSQFLLKQSGYVLPAMNKTVPQLALQKKDHVGMVGYFPPLVEQIRALGTKLTVLELDERWLQQAEEFTVTLDPAHLSGCNKIVCTGTVLVNQTLDSVLTYCGNASQILIVGPTTGCLPDPLFKRGVSLLGGNRVVEPDRFLDLWSTQQKWRGATERYALYSGADYPGVEALLSMAGHDKNLC